MLMSCNEINNNPNERVFLPVFTNAPVAMPEAVDIMILRSLEEAQIEGQPDLLVELIDLYLDDASAKLDAMREAIPRGDETLLKRVAHSLRGSSGNLGARRMATLCEELEQIDGHDLLQKADEILTRLEQEFEHVGQVFAAERQRRM